MACTFPTNAAIFAVTVVPIFSPKIIAAAIGKSIHPWTSITNVIVVEAEDDWVNRVSAVPIKINIIVDQNPKSVKLLRSAKISGFSPTSGTAFLMNSKPINKIPNPIIVSAMFFNLLLLENKKGKNMPMMLIAMGVI